MYKNSRIAVIIPALNEEESLPGVLLEIPVYVDVVLVADNGSSDGTSRVALERDYGKPVRVVREEKRGYGHACLRAMRELRDEEIVVYLDADRSDHPELMQMILDPILSDHADLALSNRFSAGLEKGAMSTPQFFGNKLCTFLIRLFWGHSYKDLGPFRAIRRSSLDLLRMQDGNYGWTIEMQIKAIEKGLKIVEVDMPYRCRERGKSKVSGTARGVILAGAKILYTILRFRFLRRRERQLR
ncbi:MAG: glycosyltransferase family 2 protein [Acidobacteriota bacterium]